MNTDQKQKPHVGRIVHYVEVNGEHLAAIITKVWSDICVDLSIFTGSSTLPVRIETSRMIDQTGLNSHYSWHWPERE